MMRWLKDKKKERRTNPVDLCDGGKEDDYGFGKEKSAAKSPSSRRQLPPTPATPEEKSPHIYEEIPDLPLCCTSDADKAVLHSKFNKSKSDGVSAAGTHPSNIPTMASSSGTTEISPYMVVPVDDEVRQTPTDFHRNGTPEVHCDVIVKDTHCEIFLTRKPKVGTFRLDCTAFANSGQNGGEKRVIRNNTHFCSQDRRASADAHSVGKLSSAFSVASSAFSSSSASKILSAGAPTSLPLMNSFDHHLNEQDEEGDCVEEGANGVITYSSASNFIHRSTRLKFNPLPGKNPCKEAFGSDSSDDGRVENFSSAKEGNMASPRDQHNGTKSITYSSIQACNNNDTGVNYTSVKDLHYTDVKLNYDCNDSTTAAHNTKQSSFQGSSVNDIGFFSTSAMTGIIRSSSPSGSSGRIYASVTFPSEPKLYNTIPDLIPSDCPGTSYQSDNYARENLGVIYSSVRESFGNDVCPVRTNETSACGNTEVVRSGKSSSCVKDVDNDDSRVPVFEVSEGCYRGFNTERAHYDSNNINYSVSSNQQERTYDQDASDCMRQGASAGMRADYPNPSSHCEHGLHLDFCSCSDDHSSSYGCPDVKHNNCDDVASVAGATNDGSNSCRSCGRLIRQITYSESYSDETYEHVYASRLLIRTGRRFSSPDLTLSEPTNSEFQEIHNPRNPDVPYSTSRDDSWTNARSSDIIPPPYSSTFNTALFNKLHDGSQSEESNLEAVAHLNKVHGDSEYCPSQINNGKSLPRQSASTNSDVQSPSGTSAELSSFVENETNSSQGVLSNLTENVWCSGSASETFVDQTVKRGAAVTLESKSNAFTGLFSKFSRTKPSKSTKLSLPEYSKNGVSSIQNFTRGSESSKCVKDLEEIPEKNTKKLSKFFQRLSSKETTKIISECSPLPETENMIKTFVKKDSSVSFEEDSSNKSVSQTFSSCGNKLRLDDQITKQNFVKEVSSEMHSRQKCTENNEIIVVAQVHPAPSKSQSFLSEPVPSGSVMIEQLSLDTSTGNDKDLPNLNLDENSKTKPQFKTDSGDTCYEYDISTSSEGEQTSYEYFLSRVKKTLNLEHEVRHIAESAARRKRLCKRCKKDELYASIDDEEGAVGGDGFCPHLAAKFSDLRAIFEDLIVDQRAAILDCLTDYMLSPKNIRCHSHERQRRGCSCEIFTSDTESLTTVCSLLSQQFRMTSPNGQVHSCDSDEGTMADNSCESADEDSPKIEENRNERDLVDIHCDDNSSGYDEPKQKLDNAIRKSKKKGKISMLSACSKEAEEQEKVSVLASVMNKNQQDLACGSKFGVPQTEASSSKLRLKENRETAASTRISDGPRKSILKKNPSTLQSTHSSKQTAGLCFSQGADSKDGDLYHSRICDISRLRASLITDKVLQDIYVPLPSTALSQLTSKNYACPVDVSCTCGKGPQPSLATVTAHLAKGETLQPPTECMNSSNASKPALASPAHCDSNKKNGVVTVQKHLEQGGKNNKEVEPFVQDGDRSVRDRQKMGVLTDKDGFAASCCSLTRNTAGSNDCIAPQKKPLSQLSMKERPIVPAKDRNSLKSRSATKPNYQIGNKSNSTSVNESHQHGGNCSKISQVDTSYTAGESVVDKHYKNPSNIQDWSYVKSKSDNSKINAHKHRQGLEALDMLPESIVDGEDVHPSTQVQNKITHPKRSKVIEKMAKLFENHPEISSAKDGKTASLAHHKSNRTKTGVTEKVSSVNSNYTSHPNTERKQATDVETLTKTSIFSPSKTIISQCDVVKQCAMQGKSDSFSLSSAVSDTRNMVSTSKTSPHSSQLSQVIEGKAQYNEAGRTRTHESKSSKSKTGRVKSSFSHLADSGLTSQRSPTPSSSSTSSSSSRKKSGYVRHKRTSKKSYHRKRGKLRSERSKSHEKEERTYYYFSSDFSDIDIVEVESSNTATPSISESASITRKSLARGSNSTRRSTSVSDDATASLSEKSTNVVRSFSDKIVEGADKLSCENELYAIPPSSSDLQSCRRKSSETCISPKQSPELVKMRSMKKIDVYKSRKCESNKLLSDLIIRNYDMQVYGNI